MADGPSGPDRHELTIRLDLDTVHVSYLSALLRVVQAALREVARSDDDARPAFDREPQPVLVLSDLATGDGLGLRFTFADPLSGRPLEEVSTQTFRAFLARLVEFVKGLPQPGLWGGAARRPAGREYESELAMRMDQVYGHLRRSPKATVEFQGRAVTIEGDRMEIG